MPLKRLPSAVTERGQVFARLLKSVHDLERLVARAALGVAGPRDLVGLKSVASLAVPRMRGSMLDANAMPRS